MYVCIMSHRSTFTYSLYPLGAPNSLIQFHLRTALLWWFNVTGNSKTYFGLHVRSAILLSNFNQISIFSTDFHKHPLYQISWKCIQWQLHSYTQTDGQTDGYGEANRFFMQIFKSVYKMERIYAVMINSKHLECTNWENLSEDFVRLLFYCTNNCKQHST
jgi:hypothetical protein